MCNIWKPEERGFQAESNWALDMPGELSEVLTEIYLQRHLEASW